MLRALLIFGAGFYFGRNRGAAGQLVGAGGQILDTYTGQSVATNVIPNTTIVSPDQAERVGLRQML